MFEGIALNPVSVLEKWQCTEGGPLKDSKSYLTFRSNFATKSESAKQLYSEEAVVEAAGGNVGTLQSVFKEALKKHFQIIAIEVNWDKYSDRFQEIVLNEDCEITVILCKNLGPWKRGADRLWTMVYGSVSGWFEVKQWTDNWQVQTAHSSPWGPRCPSAQLYSLST